MKTFIPGNKPIHKIWSFDWIVLQLAVRNQTMYHHSLCSNKKRTHMMIVLLWQSLMSIKLECLYSPENCLTYTSLRWIKFSLRITDKSYNCEHLPSLLKSPRQMVPTTHSIIWILEVSGTSWYNSRGKVPNWSLLILFNLFYIRGGGGTLGWKRVQTRLLGKKPWWLSKIHSYI